MDKQLFLEVLSPEANLFSGKVDLVRLPGSLSPFTVLYNHANMVSMLSAGKIVYSIDKKELQITIRGGFARVASNKISVCIIPE